jgi:hypothetical protein
MAVVSRMAPLGSAAPAFSLMSLAGERVSLSYFGDAPALLVAFLCNHCPYVRHIESALGEVVADLPGLGVVGICSNDARAYPADGAAGLLEQSLRAGWTFPYLVDESQELARGYGAACTPDLFLYDASRRLAYRGAFDDSTPGNDLPVTGHLLADAARRVLAGQPVPEPHRPSMGCSIKWRAGNEPG